MGLEAAYPYIAFVAVLSVIAAVHGQTVLIHGAAGGVDSIAVQLAREVGARVIGTGRVDDRDVALGLGAQTFLDLDADDLQHVGEVDAVSDVIGGDILERSTELVGPGGTIVTIVMPPTVQPKDGRAIFFVVEPDRARLADLAQRLRQTGVSCRSLAGDSNWQDAPSRLALGVFALVLSGRPQLCPASGHRNGVSQKLIENSAIAYSIVHATQFFEFVRRMADVATDGSTVRFAPVLSSLSRATMSPKRSARSQRVQR
jgi:Zinc-binding dehydrogenase